MVTILVPLFVLVVGLIMWLAPIPPKLQEMGKILFFIGALWLVFMFSQRQIKF
jgi:hypothetical protein